MADDFGIFRVFLITRSLLAMRSNRAKRPVARPRRQTLIANPVRDIVKNIEGVRTIATTTTAVRRVLTTQSTATSSRLPRNLQTWPIHPSVVNEVYFLRVVTIMPVLFELSL
jgi:hypothetical protein